MTIAIFCLLSGCGQRTGTHVQGYIEGEFAYIAAPLAGALDTLSVQRGDTVKAGDALFALENGLETAARDEAQRRLDQAMADLDDAKKGKRPSEIQSMIAQLDQARAAEALSASELDRQLKLAAAKAGTAQDLDRARAAATQDQQRVAQLQADLETARLGQRPDQIAAAEFEVQARNAELAQANWNLSQKRQNAPGDGLIFDTLYRRGEWVAAGHPVVLLLPPQDIKLRAFVSEEQLGSMRIGDRVTVTVDGVASPVFGKISFISPRAEFTPPVIYSRQSRAKLMFMIEAVFEPQVAVNLHPGQPVDVAIGAD